ncbi:MAG: hypothetical protein K6T59_15215 [Bryobacteraceae bacterium]|nr:hypothetical protein [Bryobacteraceae bacterium]
MKPNMIMAVTLFSLIACGSPTVTAAVGQNPSGVMLPSSLVRAPQGIQVAKALGAVYFRPTSIFLDQWTGLSVIQI